MTKITLKNEFPGSVTYIPNEFIDSYMTAANGEYVKIYLYLLRCLSRPEEDFSLSGIADHFDHTESDVKRALKYWEKVHLLRLEYDDREQISSISLLPGRKEGSGSSSSPEQESAGSGVGSMGPSAESASRQQTASAETEPDSGSAVLSARNNISAEKLNEFRSREDAREIIFLAETYLKRTLSQKDLSFIFSWYDELNFSPDLIEFLIENSIAGGHTSLYYMQKVAEDWHARGVRSPEEAKRYISRYSGIYAAAAKAFGIRGRDLAPSEREFVSRWSDEYGFSEEVISEACRRTIQNTHEPSFEYADKILQQWFHTGVRGMEDIQKADEDYRRKRKNSSGKAASQNTKKGKFCNFEQREYDYDQLSRQLLQKSLNQGNGSK